MYSVTHTGLFRMSFILQDSSATTTATYLSKIIESELYAANEYLSVAEISERISADLSLEFSDLEIINAIKRSNHLICDGKKRYSLKPSRMSTLANTSTIEKRLEDLVKRFLKQNADARFDVASFTVLFSRFLYHCFNANKDALLLIIDDDGKTVEKSKLDATKEECDIINDFLIWNNEEKDKLIYQVVSTCYAYCSLTVKKDTLLSESIFRNKKFYLDANIIFRMAGINKSERQRSVTAFIKNCRTLGIQLLYTSSTFSEINRVIDNKCAWLKAVSNDGYPLDLSAWEHQEDDFYELYRAWCHESENKCGDFASFAIYLHRLVNEVLSELRLVQIPNFRLRKEEEFSNGCKALSGYKKRQHTQQSLDTDINNLFQIIEERKGEDSGSLFSTSTFMISADQSFIAFAADYVEGVQIVVLPSVWLTIMLRFCGRTEDDYKAFVSFMSIRNNESTTWDIYGVLMKLSTYTSNDDVKKKVITEMQNHRDMYPVEDEDEYDDSIQRAFDAIVEAERDGQKKQLEEQASRLEAGFTVLLEQHTNTHNKYNEEMAERHEKEKAQAIEDALRDGAEKERDWTATVIATRNVDRRIKLWKIVNWVRRIATVILAIGAILLFVGWCYGHPCVEAIVEKYTPEKIRDDVDSKVNFYTVIIWSALTTVCSVLKKATESMYSNERREKMILKEKEKQLRMLSEVKKETSSEKAA